MDKEFRRKSNIAFLLISWAKFQEYTIPSWRREASPGMALSVDKDGDEDDEGEGDDGHGDGQDQQQRVLVLPV